MEDGNAQEISFFHNNKIEKVFQWFILLFVQLDNVERKVWLE